MLNFNRNAIRVLRMSKGMSQEDFAQRAGGGLTKAHVHNWEAGKAMPSLGSLLRIVNQFAVPLDIFFVDDQCYSSSDRGHLSKPKTERQSGQES